MKAQPPYSITDQGFRSLKNFKLSKAIPTVFLGRSTDVPEDEQAFCKSARSATEGFIAVAKNLRGFGKSLYRSLRGDKIWAAFSQAAYNLRKFYLLYRDEKIEEKTLISLGFLT